MSEQELGERNERIAQLEEQLEYYRDAYHVLGEDWVELEAENTRLRKELVGVYQESISLGRFDVALTPEGIDKVEKRIEELEGSVSGNGIADIL